MANVRIFEKKVWVDDTPVPLIGGEIHYWRLDPGQWMPALRRVKELGLEVVATYVCWDYHEVAPGRFDFRGETEPRRNLVGFLELLQQEGMWIILRPGPYIYSEWKNGGVPDRAACVHRLSLAFQELARPYMEAVTREALPFLASRGGRIILWQPDNEIDPWPHFYTEELGLGKEPGPFQEFLRQRYGEVERLNAAWGTAYDDFRAARAVADKFPIDPDRMRRYHDFVEFKHWYVQQVADWTASEYRKLGVDVPFLINTYSGHGTQRWGALEEIAAVAGPDIYPSQEFSLRANEHRSFLDTVRYTGSYSRLPYIAEFQAGIWHEWLQDVGAFTPNHYRLMGISALLAGAAGWNWYMLVNRDNWYQSPINEWGRVRPDLFDAFQQMTRIFNQVDPTTLDRQVSTAISFDPLQRAVDGAPQKLLQSFYEADVDYTYFDLSRESPDVPLLFYGGGEWLPRAGQEKLRQYVEAGGHLVCLGAYPRRDEHLHPLNLLEIPEPDGIASGSPFAMDLLLFGRFPVRSPWAYSYESVPGEPFVARRLPVTQRPAEELALQFDLQTGVEYTVGYTRSLGKGRLTVLGLEASPALVLALHEHFQVPIPSRSITPTVSTALFRRGGERFLLAANAGNEGKTACILLAPGALEAGEWQVEDLVQAESRSVILNASSTLEINLHRKDGAVLRLTPGMH